MTKDAYLFTGKAHCDFWDNDNMFGFVLFVLFVSCSDFPTSLPLCQLEQTSKQS